MPPRKVLEKLVMKGFAEAGAGFNTFRRRTKSASYKPLPRLRRNLKALQLDMDV